MRKCFRFGFRSLAAVVWAVLFLLPVTVHAAFEPAGIEIDSVSTGNTPQAVPDTLDAVVVPTTGDTTGYTLSGYVYTWNNAVTPLDDYDLGIGDAQVPHSDLVVISTDPDEWFVGSDGLGWYLHVKTVYFNPVTGTQLSDDTVAGPYTFDNVAPAATLRLDTSVAGQTEETVTGSPVTLLVTGSPGDVHTVYVNATELFSSATRYDFSSTAGQTLTYDVSGTGTRTLYAWFADEVGNVSDPFSLTFTILAGKSMDPSNDLNLAVGSTQDFQIAGAQSETYTWSLVDPGTGSPSTAAGFIGESTGVAQVTVRGETEGETVQVKAVSSSDGTVFLSGQVRIVPTTVVGKIILISPSGSIEDKTPTLSWYEDPAATWYQVSIHSADKSYKFSQWYEVEDNSAGFPDAVCTDGICTAEVGEALVPDTYTWWAMGWNDENGDGEWSSGMDFTVEQAVPGKVELTSPSGQAAGAVDSFVWKEDSKATWYRLYVQEKDGPYKFTQWYEIEDNSGKYPEVSCDSGSCTVTLDEAIIAGTYTWWVRGWNDDGNGDWSDGMEFTVEPVTPAKISLTSPSGEIVGAVTDFAWEPEGTASWYYLFIQSADKSYKFTQWYEIEDNSARYPEAACDGVSCNITLDQGLGAGSYTWWVMGWNSNGNGDWSDGMTFTVDDNTPAKIELTAPSGQMQGTVDTFSWEPEASANWYYIFIQSADKSYKFTQWYEIEDNSAKYPEAACDGVSCHITLDQGLGAGSYTWWVMGWNSNGNGDWSDGMVFSVD